MPNFKFTKTSIEGLTIIEPTLHGDHRGYFLETYHQKDFSDNGVDAVFVQDNQSKSKKGVLRGLHYQINNPQGKLVRVISGEIYDVAVDLRKDSKTYGQWYGIVLSEENRLQFYIPEGFAHGFLVLRDFAVFAYKCTRFYDPKDEGGLAWDDETLNIDWHKYFDGEIIVSEKDKNNMKLK